jgi:hypothetical protein
VAVRDVYRPSAGHGADDAPRQYVESLGTDVIDDGVSAARKYKFGEVGENVLDASIRPFPELYVLFQLKYDARFRLA